MNTQGALDASRSYALLREGACAVRMTRDVVLVQGPDARSWLQGQVSQDLQALAVGQSAETLLLSPQGKVDGYCRLTMLADEVALLDTETGQGEVVLERLRRFRLRVKAQLDLGEVRCLMIRGPASASSLASSGIQRGQVRGLDSPASLSNPWVVALPSTWPGYSGFDVLGPDGASAEVDAPEGDPGAFEAARIEAGVPAMGRELTEKTIPQEAGSLVEHTVSFTKGCYTGQELVARLDARGGNVARRLRGVVLASGDLPLPGREAVLVSGDREVGRLTSVAWSPGFAAPVALAYVRRDVVPPAAATVAPGGERAEIRELPLLIA
jgi:folate-binding protein YgfZ